MGRADDARRGHGTRPSTGSAHTLAARLRRSAQAASLTLVGTSRSASARGARRLACLARAATLAASLALTLAAMPAEAQTSGKLVSNTGQTDGGVNVGSDADRAQAFTTGSNAGGYKLTAVKVQTAGGSLASSATFGLYETDSSGHPTGSSLGTFTKPAGSTAGLWTFTAPSGGIDLYASTTYAFVMELSEACQTCVAFKQTQADAEDTGTGSGWGIANNTLDRIVGGTSWVASGDRSLMIEIHGYKHAVPPAPAAPGTPTVQAVTDTGDRLSVSWTAPAENRGSAVTDYDLRYYQGSADPTDPTDWIEEGEAGGHAHTGAGTSAAVTGLLPNTAYRVQVRARNANGAGAWSASGSATTASWPAAQTSVSLVGNTGQAQSTGAPLSTDLAAGFTTGSSASGYILTSVDIAFATVSGSPSYSVSIRSSSGGAPGTSLGELTKPASLSANSSNTFTASSGGIALAANTTYFLVIDVSHAGALTAVSVTSSNAEDSGGAAGWSIADTHIHRGHTTTGAWNSTSAPLRIAVDGYARSVSPSLVSNLGKANSGSSNLGILDAAQGFTTGSNAGGYVLDAVALNFTDAPSGLTVQLATGVSTTSAGTTVATLTNPGTLAAGDLRFTAPASTTLSAGTQYFVVVQGSGGRVSRTASTAEDAGAAAGWSIADDSYARTASGTRSV